ncbi:MAG: cell division protein FtsZ [SAR202 cluster bacterium Ae2-Chloro-G2]|nr:MAG: cell division protein FtsZ [SAR202 cluster bacterium Ae2-Chloro-G2]
MTMEEGMTINGRELEGVARIKVIGIGGGGSNAVSRMFRERVSGVDYIVMNTDVQALMGSDVPIRIRIGEQLTQGMGVGGNPEKGAASAEESREEIYDIIRDSDMIFVAAGMGGGTGTGAAPVIAEIARETGALTVGVVTRPFSFEGNRRSKQAQDGVEKLQGNVDTLLVIPNERLSVVAKEEVTAENAFRLADDVLRLGVQSITELITNAGDINLDFADVQSVMRDAGPAWMSIGWGSGDSRARDAAQQAITNPLMDVSIEGATGVLFNITGGSDLKLNELHQAAEVIQRVVDPDANIIFGMSTDPKMENEIKLTIIATGFPTTETLIRRDIEKTVDAAQRVEGNEDSLDLPPFLRRNLGGFSVTNSINQNGHSSGQ